MFTTPKVLLYLMVSNVNMQHPDKMSGAGTSGTTWYFGYIFGDFSKGGALPHHLIL